MPIINRIAEFQADMVDWRRDIHAHPETAFEENRTADLVAARLEEFGLSVHRGLAKTGVIGTLSTGDGPAIGLRADMDALHISEANEFDHKSTHDGKMHACGHDGHTAMLLGAARYLAETKNFKGTVHFIFQPAEETEGGGQVMVEEGLFDKFPAHSVFGMHNWPGLPVGHFAAAPGLMMAAADTFEITVNGKGSHAAMPHLSDDPIIAAAAMVTALQTITSRATDPMDSVVVSVTQFHGGDAWNVIPAEVVLRGTARTFRSQVQDHVEAAIERILNGIAAAHRVSVHCHYRRRYPSVINHAAETELACRVAAEVSGDDKVDRAPPPSMGAEDFSFMLNERPGCYIRIGNGPGEGGCILHNPHYDFNDEILAIGASYWARLAETVLAETVLAETS